MSISGSIRGEDDISVDNPWLLINNDRDLRMNVVCCVQPLRIECELESSFVLRVNIMLYLFYGLYLFFGSGV